MLCDGNIATQIKLDNFKTFIPEELENKKILMVAPCQFSTPIEPLVEQQ